MRANLSEEREILYRSMIEEAEFQVLEAISFDVDHELPYKYIIEFGTKFLSVASKENIIDIAFKFCNDSFKLPLCLFFHPKIIAAACIYMAL